MKDLIKETCQNVSIRNNTEFKTKFYAIRKILKDKYHIDVSKISLLNRMKEWRKGW